MFFRLQIATPSPDQLEVISRYASFTTVVLTLFIFTACGPEWAGSWKITRVDGEPVKGEPDTYYDLSEETITQIFEGPDDKDCTIFTFNISEIDGNVVTFGKAEEKVRYEVSGDTLKITSLASQDKQTARAVDGDPRDVAGCER